MTTEKEHNQQYCIFSESCALLTSIK